MKGRPLCVASVLLIVIIFLWNTCFPDEKQEEELRETAAVTCRVDEIQGRGEQSSLVVCDVTDKGKVFCKRMKVYGKSGNALFADLKIGQIISMDGTISSFSKPGNPGQFNEYEYYREQGIQYLFFVKALHVQNDNYNVAGQWLQEFRVAWCANLEKCLPAEEAGIMAAMILGDKSGLSTEVKDLYKENGIAHILAISGLHVSLLGMGLFFLLRRFVMPMRAAAGVTAAFLLFYGEMTGFSVSTQRAVLMMLCMLGARFLGKQYDRLSALALSAILQLIVRPELLFQSGFLFSYGTVLGIAVFVEPFDRLFEEKGRVWRVLAGPIGIFLVNFPILLYFSYEFNPYSFLVNAVILPFAGGLLVFAIAGSALVPIWQAAADFLAGTVHFILRYYHMLCRFTERLPISRVITGQPDWWQMAAFYGLLGLFCLIPKDKKGRLVPVFAAVAVLLLPGMPQRGFTITNLDVGQGDCACLRVSGSTVLIDGGSSDVKKAARYRIAPYLKSQGIDTLDYIFLTHSDSDHINGIYELLQDTSHMGFQIGTIVLPMIQNPDEAYLDFYHFCQREKITTKKMKAGDSLQIEKLTLRCLHPAPDFAWNSENNYSLVLMAEYGAFRGLFSGDLEREAEEMILTSLSPVDYLKVSHHGSKGATGEKFLQKTHPSAAVISVGKRNRYGHPAEETLARLRAAGTQIFTTIQQGAVTLYTDGGGTWRMSTYRTGYG